MNAMHECMRVLLALWLNAQGRVYIGHWSCNDTVQLKRRNNCPATCSLLRQSRSHNKRVRKRTIFIIEYNYLQVSLVGRLDFHFLYFFKLELRQNNAIFYSLQKISRLLIMFMSLLLMHDVIYLFSSSISVSSVHSTLADKMTKDGSEVQNLLYVLDPGSKSKIASLLDMVVFIVVVHTNQGEVILAARSLFQWNVWYNTYAHIKARDSRCGCQVFMG